MIHFYESTALTNLVHVLIHFWFQVHFRQISQKYPTAAASTCSSYHR